MRLDSMQAWRSAAGGASISVRPMHKIVCARQKLRLRMNFSAAGATS